MFLFVLDYIGKEFVQSPLRGSSGCSSSRSCHSGATTFHFLYISPSTLYSNPHAPEVTYNHCEKTCLPRARASPLVAFWFFMVPVDEVPVSVNTLYMSFSTVLYFPLPTVTFTQCDFISSSPACVCGRLGVQSRWFLRGLRCSGYRPVCWMWGLCGCASCQGHDDLSSILILIFYICVLLTIISCSGAFFFHGRPNFSSEDSLFIFIFI